MITIYKYQIEPCSFEPNLIMMPVSSAIISCGVDGNNVPCIWVLLDTDEQERGMMVTKKIWCVGTGWDLSPMFNGQVPGYNKIGTIKENVYIWHVFEEGMPEGGL